MLPKSFSPEYLRQLELMRIRARRAFLGTRQGGHQSIKRGHGIEFSDYRKYVLGDNPRHIDWGVFARNEKLYVKRFQEEQDLQVLIVIDGSASMITPDEDGKWQMACDIALSLIYIALMQHDTVRICVPGLFDSAAYSGGRAFHSASRDLMEVVPGERKDFLEGVRRGLSRMRFPGLAIFISDFLLPPETIRTSINAMRAKNLDITAIQVLGPHDLSPEYDRSTARFIDSETGEELLLSLDEESLAEYSYLLDKHNTALQEFLTENRISFSQALTTQGVREYVIHTLSQVSGLLG